MRASVNQKLEESGEKEKLKELLRKKLIERGWRDELKEYCKEVGGCAHLLCAQARAGSSCMPRFLQRAAACTVSIRHGRKLH